MFGVIGPKTATNCHSLLRHCMQQELNVHKALSVLLKVSWTVLRSWHSQFQKFYTVFFSLRCQRTTEFPQITPHGLFVFIITFRSNCHCLFVLQFSFSWPVRKVRDVQHFSSGLCMSLPGNRLFKKLWPLSFTLLPIIRINVSCLRLSISRFYQTEFLLSS